MSNANRTAAGHSAGQHVATIKFPTAAPKHHVFAAAKSAVAPAVVASANSSAVVHSLSGCLNVKSRFFRCKDIAFTTVAGHSATATEGQLVLYRVGIDDPDQVIADALARGAAGILTEQLLPAPIAQCIVSDVESVAGKLAAATADRPDTQLVTIAVMGSAGKTTTVAAIADVLGDIPTRVSVASDWVCSDGVAQTFDAGRAAAGAALVQHMNDAIDAGAAVSVVELSDAAIRSGSYDGLSWDIVVVCDKAETSGDFGPAVLPLVLERVKLGGVVVAPVADVATCEAVDASDAMLCSYGVDEIADVSIKTVRRQNGVQTALLRYKSAAAVMETMLAGPLASLAAAAAVGVMTENPLAQIAESLARVLDVPGRMQTIRSLDMTADPADHLMVLIDNAATPQRIAATLRAARELIRQGGRITGGKVWAVMVMDPSVDAETLTDCGGQLARWAGQTILTCDPNAKNDFLTSAHAVIDGVTDIMSTRWVADRASAIDWAVGHAAGNDAVVILNIAGSRSGQMTRSLCEIEDVIQSSLAERQSVRTPLAVELKVFRG